MPLPPDTVASLVAGTIYDPFSVLGLHAEGPHLVVRAWVRGASEVAVQPRDGGPSLPLTKTHPAGLFEGAMVGRSQRFAYDLHITDLSGSARIARDVYAFWTQLSSFDLDLFRAGRHHHLGDILGAHVQERDGVKGVRFAVWAPNARRAAVVGDWNDFDGTAHPMRPREPYGVWEIFLPGMTPGMRYKFEILGHQGEVRVKADPFAAMAEVPPATASIIAAPETYRWGDQRWILDRAGADVLARPMAVYEVHLGSWHRGAPPKECPNYRDLAAELIPYVQKLGFTHIELLPLAQHPFEGSWGYQVTGQYAPNSRHGSPDDLKWFVDQCHQADIGVIVDYVPAHFPKDDFALARFDGTPCFEYEDSREGEHKTWGTHVFNYRRPEVRNFLLAAALHWCRRYHIDGLRVDAVSSMLYRDYDRTDGGWIANEQGGNANLEAVNFLQELTSTVRSQFPGVLTIAEESTAWQGVTAPTDIQGLGFDLKWNMGWMHDTLDFLKLDPVLRPGSHDRITFHQWYAYDDKWVLPLSHDEVVHGKGSLIDKMPGDWWRKRAQLRLLLGWQAAIPGRKLLFQGGEFAVGREFAWETCLNWNEAAEPDRRGVTAFLAKAFALYRSEPALHLRDDHRDGFAWVDCENRPESVVAFLRRAPGHPDVLVACNFTPVPRPAYPLGVPVAGRWKLLLSSDDTGFGGAATGIAGDVEADSHHHGTWPARVHIDLPPLAIVFLRSPG